MYISRMSLEGLTAEMIYPSMTDPRLDDTYCTDGSTWTLV